MRNTLEPEPIMQTFKTKLAGRKGPSIQPTIDEALAMHNQGFRFSIYRPETGEVQLSRPVHLMIVPQRDELIFEQP